MVLFLKHVSYCVLVLFLIACQVSIKKTEFKIVLPTTGAGDITSDSTHIYWTDEIDGTVMRMNLATEHVNILAQQQEHPEYLILDEDYVYWFNRTTQMIYRVSKSGGRLETIAHTAEPNVRIYLDEDTLYWSEREEHNRIMAIAKDGSTEPWVVYELYGPETMIKHDHILYVLSYKGLVAVDLHTKTGTIIDDRVGGPWSYSQLIASDKSLYWVEASQFNPTLFRYDFDSGRITQMLNSKDTDDNPYNLTQDDNYIYGTSMSGAITQIDKTTGASHVLYNYKGFTILRDIVVDDQWIYWRDETNKAIMKLTKP